MKKGIIAILCCAAGLLLGACGANKEFVLTGKFDNCTAKTLVVASREAGIDQTVDIADDGTFEFRCHVDKPLFGYIFCDDAELFAFIYLINGTSTHITADAADRNSIHIGGDLESAYRIADAINNSTAIRSRKHFESFAELQQTWHELQDSAAVALKSVRNADFRKMQQKTVAENALSAALEYAHSLSARGLAPDSDADLNAYMERFDWNSSSGYYAAQVLNWMEACAGRAANPSYANMISTAAGKIKDKAAVAKLTMDMMSTYFAMGADSHIDEVCEEALKHVDNEKQREWIENYHEKLKNIVPGIQALDCELETLDGKTLHLSDLYGEVLFIDIWATWCGPCCAEIPYLEKLVERFRGDDRVRIVSITVDRDRKAWEKKLAEDKPEWEQYRCVDFCELYGIAGIPCFMMIDRDGKLITMQAPRPSDDGCDDFIISKL